MDMDHDSMCIQFYFDGIYLNASNIKKTRCKNCGKEEKKSFTFVGVGDNLYHNTQYMCQEQNEYYNFDSYYEMTNKYTQKADLAYINFETLCIGEEYGLSGYPTFNGPTETFIFRK